MLLQGTARINEKNHLEIGGCDTVELAKQYGTPLNIMDEDFIRETCRAYKATIENSNIKGEVIYAGKAFLSTGMCKIMEEEGLGLDVVSGGELYTAIKAEFPPEHIYFHGNNKLYNELEMAVEYGVGRIVVDNDLEMEMLSELSKKYDKEINILLRITPGIEAHTHDYIKTGQIDSKFGFGLENGQAIKAVERVLHTDGITLKGFHCHIGSQIFETDPFMAAAEVIMKFSKQVLDKFDYVIEEINVGGGFGIKYTQADKPLAPQTYLKSLIEAVKLCAKNLSITEPKIMIEPGRSIVGAAGTTIYSVGAIKEIPNIRKYVCVDGGMFENIRPALYGAKYDAILANKANDKPEEKVTIAGKCCESGDMLIWDIELPKAETGDILAIFSTGAYHYSMASNYNRNLRQAVVLVKDGKSRLLIKRETYDDLLKNDVL